MFAAENGLRGDPRLKGISDAITVVPHFPKPGIMFQDITTLVSNPKAFKDTIDIFVDRYRDMDISVVAGVEARGFMFAPAIALAIGAKFIPLRKPRKLPGEVISEAYELEYGKDCLEMHVGAVQHGERALIIDDLVATGGTLSAATRLLERVGAEVVECACVIGLPEVKGRCRLDGKPLYMLVEPRQIENYTLNLQTIPIQSKAKDQKVFPKKSLEFQKHRPNPNRNSLFVHLIQFSQGKKRTGKRDSLICSSVSDLNNFNNVCNSVREEIFLRRDTNNVIAGVGITAGFQETLLLIRHLPGSVSYLPPRSLIDQLKSLFPDMDSELLGKVLEESGNDLDAAIKSLLGLRVGYAEGAEDNSSFAVDVNAGLTPSVGDAVLLEDSQVQNNLPVGGAEWVELFVKEMMSATSIDDARFRTTRVLEGLEKSICSRVGSEAAQNFQKENMMLKEQIEALLRDNAILKRAVSIQHEREKEYDESNQEVQQLKQLVAQYQEQLRTLEVNNYALTLHLRQAQQIDSIPGRFHPDVF